DACRKWTHSRYHVDRHRGGAHTHTGNSSGHAERSCTDERPTAGTALLGRRTRRFQWPRRQLERFVLFERKRIRSILASFFGAVSMATAGPSPHIEIASWRHVSYSPRGSSSSNWSMALRSLMRVVASSS